MFNTWKSIVLFSIGFGGTIGCIIIGTLFINSGMDVDPIFAGVFVGLGVAISCIVIWISFLLGFPTPKEEVIFETKTDTLDENMRILMLETRFGPSIVRPEGTVLFDQDKS